MGQFVRMEADAYHQWELEQQEKLDMVLVTDMSTSKYLKKEDVGRGMLGTIIRVERQDVSMADQSPEMKWVLYIKEHEKPLVLNSTNRESIAEICQPGAPAEERDTEYWVGKRIVLFTDDSIMFGGKKIGGIRIRAPKASAPPADDPVADPDLDDDIPF